MILTTNVVASITCPGQTNCNPTNTNSITWNSIVPTTRPYSISDHNLSLISGNCNNYQYDITFNLPASDVPVLFNEISFPFAFDPNSFTNLTVTDQAGNSLNYTNASNRLIIPINNTNLPSGFNFNQDFNGVVGSVDAFSLTLNVQFTLNSSNDCPTLAFSGISNLNTQLNFAQILFQSVCLTASQSNLDRPLPSRYNRPNTAYNLSGVCPESNLTPNSPAYELDFNYVFANTSNLNPLAFYESTAGAQPIGCQDFDYEFIIYNEMSTLDNSNLFSSTGNTNYTHLSSIYDGQSLLLTINGTAYPCTINNNSIIARVPSSAITQTTTISAHFALDGCPFDENANASGAIVFWFQVRAVCNTPGCGTVSRVLVCLGNEDVPSCVVGVQCIGGCAPTVGYQGAQTAESGYSIERVSYGWASPAASQPITNRAEFVSLFDGSELLKVYPYDIIKVDVLGSFAYSQFVDDFAFELATTPLLGETNGSNISSILEIVPGSALLTTSTGSTYTFNDNFVFTPNTFITYGEQGGNTINLPVDLLVFQLDQINTFFTDVQAAPNQTVNISFSALFRVKPERKLFNNPLQAFNSYQDINFRAQFLTGFDYDTEFESSCEQYWRTLGLYTPGLVIHSGVEEYGNAILDLPIDDINPSASTFNYTQANEHGHCNANFGYGVYSFGGSGPLSDDFQEFRPLFSWPASGTIQNNSNLVFDYYNLYNDGMLGSGQITNQQITAFPSRYEKGAINNLGVYSGIAISVDKNSPSEVSCGETDGSDDFIVNIPIIPFAYVTNSAIPYPSGSNGNVVPYSTTELGTIQNTISNTPITVQNLDNYLSNQLFPVAGLNMNDLCQRLRGSTTSGALTNPPLDISEQFSYTFNFGSPFNASTQNFPALSQRVWALAALFDENDNPVTGALLNLSSTPQGPSGATIFNGPNGEVLIYFENEPSSTQQINLINSAPLTCLPNNSYLKITYGMFCNDVVGIDPELSEFFSDPEAFSCSNCERIVPLNQQYGLTYSTNSSISYNIYPSCNLQWNIVLENPENNLTLNKNQIRFVLPDGLLPPMLANGDIVYTYTNGQGQQVSETPNFNVSFGGASVSGGPVADVSTVMDIQFDPVFAWQQGAQISFTLNFVFSSELCEVISPKIGTELQLIVFSVPACYSPANHLNIPIESNSEYPVLLSQAEDLVSMLQPDQDGNSCCKDYHIDLFVQDECPSLSNGYVYLNDVFELIGDDVTSYIGNCSLTLYNNSNQIILSIQSINGPFTIPNLAAGTYMLAINVDNGINPPFLLFEGFVIESNSEQCVSCDCADGSSPIIVNQNITNGLTLRNFVESFNEDVCFYIKQDITFLANQETITLQDEEFIFAPGIELKMNQGSVVNILGCRLSGCERLWKGINTYAKQLLVGRSNSTFNITEISDALYGIYLGRYLTTVFSPIPTPNTFCFDVLFTNNFIGIASNHQEFGNHNLVIAKSTKFSGGNLLLGFEGQPVITYNRSFAGIRVQNGFILNLLEFTLFTNLKFGVLAYDGANVYVEKTEFNRIADSAPQYNQNFSSYFMPSGSNVPTTAAICVHRNSRLYVLGFGAEENSPTMFNNCRIGVLSHRSRVDVHKSKFDWDSPISCDRAIVLFDVNTTRNAIIESNSIRARKIGIEALLSGQSSINNATSAISIINNRVVIPHQNLIFQPTPDQNTGILINATIPQMASIINNTVEIEQQFNTLRVNGIILNGTRQSTITGNVVERFNNSRGVGFFISASESPIIENNTSLGQTTNVGNNNNSGFMFSLNNFAEIKQNCTDNTRLGFSFHMANPSTIFGGNFMQNHNYNNGFGLRINPGATIGNQVNAQNQWLTSYGGDKARNDGDQSNLFLVNTNTNSPDPIYYPEHTPEDPDNDCTSDPFIQCVSGTSAIATQCLAQGSTVSWIGTGNPNDEEESREKAIQNANSIAQRMINGQIVFEEYPEENNYTLQKSMEALLNDNLTYMPDTGAFYILRNTLHNTNLARLNEIEKVAIGKGMDTSLASLLKSFHLELDSIINLVHKADSLFATNNDTLGSAPDLERQELHTLLKEKQEQVDAQTLLYETAEQLQRDSVRAMNDRIVSSRYYEIYDRELNAIEVERLNAEVMYYEPYQQQIIEQIATLCPVAGGPAVYKARAMMTLFNDTLDFQDDSLCALQGYAYRLAQEQTDSILEISQIIVYPNPSQSTFTVFTGISNIDELKILTVYNALGQVVITKSEAANQIVLDFATNALAQGIYILQIHFPTIGTTEYKKLIYAK